MSEILVIFGATIFVSSLINKTLVYPLAYVDGMNRHFADINLACAIFIACVLVDIFFAMTKKMMERTRKGTQK